VTCHVAQWTIDAADVPAAAAFWADALGFQIRDWGDDGSAKLYPPVGAAPAVATVWIQHTADEKRAKNRAHPDLRPIDGDVEREVDRLVELGARKVDIGQGRDDPYVVLVDPAGNEFCVLRNEPR
jgi:predicted enzyme related to lactoylglutathione lyase